MSETKYIIQCENLVKIYKTKDIEVLALQGLELNVEYGELMAIIGNSGSGKSTFLNMIGGLDRPSAGELFVDGKDLFKLDEKQLVAYKRSTVGFVWQNNARNLIPYLTALQNVQLPMMLSNLTDSVPSNPTADTASKSVEAMLGIKAKSGVGINTQAAFTSKNKKERALHLLDLTGILHKRNSKLSQLSGGEQQRIAIALALSNNPKILLADEPTGSVDTNTSNYLLDVFKKVNTELGITIVIVTHDRQLSTKVNRVVAIRDGKTSSEMVMRRSYRDELTNLVSLGGEEAHVQEEFAILDKAGRVQIPHEMLGELGLDGNKIKVELIDGKIVMSAPTLKSRAESGKDGSH